MQSSGTYRARVCSLTWKVLFHTMHGPVPTCQHPFASMWSPVPTWNFLKLSTTASLFDRIRQPINLSIHILSSPSICISSSNNHGKQHPIIRSKRSTAWRASTPSSSSHLIQDHIIWSNNCIIVCSVTSSILTHRIYIVSSFPTPTTDSNTSTTNGIMVLTHHH